MTEFAQFMKFGRTRVFGSKFLVRPEVLQSKYTLEISKTCVSTSARKSILGDVVCEPFMGSGTTLIAAQTVGRICLGIELNPAYVEVAIRRWQDFTGELAVLIATARYDARHSDCGIEDGEQADGAPRPAQPGSANIATNHAAEIIGKTFDEVAMLRINSATSHSNVSGRTADTLAALALSLIPQTRLFRTSPQQE